MQKSILAVSDDKEFLEEIRSHLEEGGRFRIRSASSGTEALNIATNETFDVAILDAEISDIPFVPFTRNLVATHPYLKLLIYPPYNNPHHPVIKGLVANGFLNKPFFAPEVGSALADLFVPPPDEYPEEEPIQADSLNAFLQKSHSFSTSFEQPGVPQVNPDLAEAFKSPGIIDEPVQVDTSSPAEGVSKLPVNEGLPETLPEPTTAELPDLEEEAQAPQEPTTAELPDLEIEAQALQVPTTAELTDLEDQEQPPQEPTTAELPDLEVEDQTPTEPTTAELPDLEIETQTPAEPTSAELPDLEHGAQLPQEPTTIEFLEQDITFGSVPEPTNDELSKFVEETPHIEEPAIGEIPDFNALVNDTSISESPETLSGESFSAPADATVQPINEDFGQTPDSDEQTAESTLEAPPPLTFTAIETEEEELTPVTEDTQQLQIENGVYPAPGEIINEATLVEADDLPQELYAIEDLSSEGLKEDLELPDWLEGIDSEINALEPLDIHDMVSESELRDLDSLMGVPTALEADEPLVKAVDFPPPLPIFESDVQEPVEPDIAVQDETLEPSIETGFHNPLPPAEAVLPAAVLHYGEADLAGVTSEVLPQTQLPIEDLLPRTSPLGLKGVRLDYSCVIIPRNPKQFIARELSERLGFILPQLHISNGWRMNGLSIRPYYLSWRFSIPASVCPADAVLEIKQRTTSHFYANFPRLSLENDPNDFWAPGYLIISGRQSLSATLIQDFIDRTRNAQKEAVS